MKRNKNIIASFAKAVSFSLGVFLILTIGYWIVEPNIVGAAVDTDDVIVNLNVLSTISLNTPSDVNMAPDITGTGSSTGNVVWQVTTNDSAGWKLEVEASGSPAMASGGDTFADYGEAVEGTPETWSIAASVSEFGFGATGTYVLAKYGADKYMGFNSTTNEQVSTNSAEGSAVETTVIFKAEVGASKSQPSGAYLATVTATATTLP